MAILNTIDRVYDYQVVLINEVKLWLERGYVLYGSPYQKLTAVGYIDVQAIVKTKDSLISKVNRSEYTTVVMNT